MRRYPITAILSVLNLLLILWVLGELPSLANFITGIPNHDFRDFISGAAELLVQYLASLLIVYLSFCRLPVKGAAAVRIFCPIIVCLVLDILFCLFVYRMFFIV